MSSRKQRQVAYSQNFLHSRKLVTQLVAQSSIDHEDLVIEIGPGKGIITDALAERSRYVLAVEKDPRHAQVVQQRFANHPNVTVFACDFLAFPLPESAYKVFANIPYRITSAIVGKLTTGLAPPQDTYLIVQREAAEKFAGLGEATMRSIALQPWFDSSIKHEFRRRDFAPQPAVDSVLLRLRLRDHPLLGWEDRDQFQRVVEAGFSAWQPTIGRAVQKLLPREAAHHIQRRIGRTLATKPSHSTIENWLALYAVLVDLDDDRTWAALRTASGRLRQQQASLDRPQRTGVSRKRRGRG